MIHAFLAANCANVAVPEATEQAMHYYNTGNVLWIVQQAWSLIVPLIFLFTGFSGKLSSISQRWGRNWFFTIIVYLLLFTPIFQLLNLPLDYYSGYVREHAYDLSTQSVSKWFINYGLSYLVLLIGSLAFVWIFYLLLKKSPKRWWFYSSLASIGILFFLVFIQPIWIDPLFNHFGPMKDKKLEAQILQLAQKAGIEDGRVFEVDKSQETKMLNAYVVGFDKTNRIVLWDTTLQQMAPDEILFVMGHEMGHYVLKHVWWGLVYYSCLAFAIFYLTYKLANISLQKFKKIFGFKDLSTIASLPLLLFLITFWSLVFTPLSNAVSRYMEHEADRFGLEITQNNVAAAKAFILLQQQNLANPRPGSIYVFWRSTHPPLAERIEFCNHYCPWKEGTTLKYSKHFTED